jgi:hypothetical protein
VGAFFLRLIGSAKSPLWGFCHRFPLSGEEAVIVPGKCSHIGMLWNVTWACRITPA